MSANKNARKTRQAAKKKPPEALIQKALDALMQKELANFAGNLETARGFWRRFPELVEAPDFPEQLRTALLKERGSEPDDDCATDENVLDPGYRETLREDAIGLTGFLQREMEHVG